MIFTVVDASKLHLCSRGLRVWFADKDITFLEFVRSGVSAEWLRQFDDALVKDVIKYMEDRDGCSRV